MKGPIKKRADSARGLAQQGETYRMGGYLTEALDCFDEALTMKDDAWTRAHRGALYLQMGHSYYEQALADFDQAINLKPNYPWAFAQRGEIKRLMKRYQEALEDFNQAIEQMDNFAWAHAHRAAVYRFMGPDYYDQALADLEIAISLDPAYSWAWAYRFVIYRLQGHPRKALFSLVVATQIDDSIILHPTEEFGTLFVALKQIDEANACTLEGLRQKPHDHRLMYIHAVLHAHSRAPSEAKAEIERARAALESVKTTHPGDSLYGLAGLAALEGNSDQALNYLKQAILLDKLTYAERAQHDVAWRNLHEDSRFKELIGQASGV